MDLLGRRAEIGYKGSSLKESFEAKVFSVTDGDTVNVLRGKERLVVRLLNIDAPESTQGIHGRRSTEYLKSQLPLGSKVKVVPSALDSYGRVAAELHTDRNINLDLVSKGHAFVYDAFLDPKKARAYKTAERAAQSRGENIWEVPGGIQRPFDHRVAKARKSIDPKIEKSLGEFSDIIRPAFKLSNDRKTEITGETVYLPTQLPTSFLKNYGSQNPKIYQSYFETVNGSEPTGFQGHVLKTIDAQLADPGLGLSLNRLTGLDLYQKDRGILGSSLALFGRALDNLSGFHYMRHLEEIQDGSTMGSMRRLHRESYEQDSYTGPFENTANFLTETIASTASSVALYFGVTHALSLYLSHIEQVSIDNIVSNLYSKGSKPLATTIARGFISVLPKEVEGVIEAAGEANRALSTTAQKTLGEGVTGFLDELIENRINSRAVEGHTRIVEILDTELAVVSKGEQEGLATLSDGDKKNRLRKAIGLVDVVEGSPNNQVTKRVWNMGSFMQSGVATNMSDAVGILRRAESSLVETVVIPLLDRFMIGDPVEKREALKELLVLSRSPVGLNLSDNNVTGMGVARKSQAASIWDKVASVISANFFAADQNFAQALGTADDTVVRTRGADGVLRAVKGSSIAVNSFIGSGFVDIINTTTKIGGIISSAVTGGTFSLKGTMSGVYDDFYDSRKGPIPVTTSRLRYSLDTGAAGTLGSVANVRRGLFIAGAALIADRIVDAYYLKPQGVDLLSQLTAEVTGSMGRDENRIARNEFTGTMPEFVKTGSLLGGAALGGFLFAKNAEVPGGLVKRFNYKFAALGAVGALFAAQGVTSVAASYLNFIYQRGKNNGLHLSAEGSAVAGLFSSTVKRERENPETTAERIAAQTVLMRAAKDYTRPEVKSVRSIYNVAVQLPNPIFQLTFVSRRDPVSGTTSYSGGFQLLPILGSGAIPTSPFGVKTGADVTSSIQRRMLAFLSDMPKPLVGDRSSSSDPAVRATYNNEMALLSSSSFTDFTNVLQFIPESQMFGALGTIGAISYARTAATAFAPVSVGRPSTSLNALKDVVGFGVGQTERLIRLGQVPTLLLPDIAKTFLQNLTASKEVKNLAGMGKVSRVLGPYGLALAAGFSLTSLDSSFGGAASLFMLKAEHDIKQNPAYDASGVINAATAQSLYTGTAVGLYYGTALQRSGAFAPTEAFLGTYEQLKGSQTAEQISKLTGDNYYRYTMGEIYSKSGGDAKLIDSMGVRTGMAARRLFKYGALAYGLGFLASATGALSQDNPLSGILDPLRLTGFNNLTQQQELILAGGQKQGGRRADGTLGGVISAGSSFFFGNFFGFFNAGKLTGAYQDNPGMFVNVAGAFGFSESTYGAKPYIQSTTAFMDISNSQVDMRVLFGQSQESVKLLKNVLKASKGSTSSQLYYALIGSTPRKTPVRLKGGFTSSELRAASSSSGVARALAIRQAEQMRLANQRTEELDYSTLYDQVQRAATAKAKGSKRVFMPGGASQFSVFTTNVGFREHSAIENILKALDPNSSLDSSFYDSYERDVITQQASEVPFVSSYIRTLTQAGSLYEQGSSPLGIIDLALGVALTAGLAVSTYSFGTSLFGAFALSSIESRKSRLTRDISNLTDAYVGRYQLIGAPRGYGLARRSALLEKNLFTLKSGETNRSMIDVNPGSSLQDLRGVYRSNRINITNYTAYINAETSYEEVATAIRRHYMDGVFKTGLYGNAVEEAAFLDSLDKKLGDVQEKGGIFHSIADNSPTAQLEKQRAYLEFIDDIDEGIRDKYFSNARSKPSRVISKSFSRTQTPLSPTAAPEVKNLRQTIGQIGYTGTLKEAAGGMGQAFFSLSTASDLYSLASALTQAGSKETRDRDIAAYYAANMLVETFASFAALPLIKLVTANLVASGVLLAGTIIGLNVDRMTGGNVGKAASQQVEKINKKGYEPGLRSIGRLISNVTSQGPISGFLTAVGAPFRLVDPLFTDLYIKSQQNVATTFLGELLLPRTLNAYLLRQTGLLPSDTTILGRRFEEYTQAQTDANRTQRYIQSLRRASSLGSSISDELLHPNTSGGAYAEYNSRVGIGNRYQTAGYATRIASEAERPSRVSGLLRLGLRQKQANVNFTISAAYRGPDNVVEDMLGMFFPLQYLKAGYYQHGSSFRAFALVNAEAVGILISKLTNAVNFFDPTFDGSPTNRFISLVGGGFKSAAKGVAKFISSRTPSLGQVKVMPFGIGKKLSEFATASKNTRVSIRNWGRLHLPGVGVASAAALVLQPMAQKTALLLGADEKTSGLIGSAAAIGGAFGSVALAPKFVSMAWSDPSKVTANKQFLGLTYRAVKQTGKASIFGTAGFVLGSTAALGINAGLSVFGKELNEEGFQNLLNVTTVTSTAASLGYYGVLTARNQRQGVSKKPVMTAPYRHVTSLLSRFSKLFKSRESKLAATIFGLTAAGAGGFLAVHKWWDGLSSRKRAEVQQSTFEALSRTAATSGIIAGIILPGVAVRDFTVGKHSAILQSRFGENALYKRSISAIQSLRQTVAVGKTALSKVRSLALNYMPRVRSAAAAISRPVAGVGLSMSALLLERRILDLNETSTRIKRDGAYRQFFSAAATTGLMALTRGKLSYQIISLSSLSSILEKNDAFDNMIDSYSKDATPQQAATLYTGTAVGLTGLFAATTIAARKVPPRFLRVAGGAVQPALMTADIVQSSYERHKGLKEVETRSSIMNRIADQISDDASRVSLAAGIGSLRGFNPKGLLLAGGGFAASILFQTPEFKNYIKREYATKFAQSGVTSRQGVARVLKKAAQSSDTGATLGTVLSGAAVLGVAALKLVGSAAAVGTAPAWGPFALAGLFAVGVSGAIGAGLGYKFGLDNELEASARKNYGDGPRRPPRRQLKPEYRDKVKPSRNKSVGMARAESADSQFSFSPNVLSAAFTNILHETSYSNFSFEPSDLSYVGQGYVRGDAGKGLQIIQTTAPKPSSRFNVSTANQSATKGFVWGSGWDSGPQWQWSAGYQNHASKKALVMKNQSVYFSYTDIDYGSAGEHFTTDYIKETAKNLDRKHWGVTSWENNPVNPGQDFYAMTSKPPTTWKVSGSDDILFHNSRVKHLRITTLADVFTWIKTNYPKHVDFWAGRLSQPHEYTGVYGTGQTKHTINHSPYLISEIAEHYGEKHFGVKSELQSTSLPSHGSLFGSTPNRSVLAKRMAARAFLLGISSPANVQRSMGAVVSTAQSVFAGVKSAPVQANFFGSLSSDVAKSFESGDPLGAAAQVALGTGFGYGLESVLKHAAPKLGPAFASGLTVAKPLMFGLAAREGSNFLMRMLRLGLYGSPEDNEGSSDYISDAAIDTTSNVVGVGTGVAVAAKGAESIVQAVKGFSVAAKGSAGLQGFVKAAATMAQAKAVTVSSKILLPALALVLGTGSFTPVGRSEPDINKNPEMFNLPSSGTNPPQPPPPNKTSLVKPSFIDSLFGIKPAAASEEDLIEAAKARRDALLTTFVIDKDPETGKLPQWESREPKKVHPKSWWERLFEWTGQTLRQLGRGVKGAVRFGANVTQNFVGAATEFFTGSFNESMIPFIAMAALESSTPQGRTNVVQSMLNRHYAAVHHGLNFYQRANDPGSLIIAKDQYQPVRDGGPRSEAAWLKAANTGLLEDYITAMSLYPSMGGDKDKALRAYRQTQQQVSDPQRQAIAAKTVGPITGFENLGSFARNRAKRGTTGPFVNDGEGQIYHDQMGPGSAAYGRTSTMVAPFPSLEGGFMQSFGGSQRVRFTRQSDGKKKRNYIHVDLRPNRQPLKGQQTVAESQLVQRTAFAYIQEAFRQGETEIEVYSPKTKGSTTLTPRTSIETIKSTLQSAGMGHWNPSYAIDFNLLNLRTFVAPDMGKITGGAGGGEPGFYTTSSGVAALHGRNLVSAPKSAASTAVPAPKAPQLPPPSTQPAARTNVPNARRANQKDWSAQTSVRPGRIVIAAGHADAPGTGAPGERRFNMLVLDRLEQRLEQAGLGGRVSIYRPGAALPGNDPRSQWSIALRTAQQGNLFLELHMDQGNAEGRSGLILPSPKDKRFPSKMQLPNPTDEDLAAEYGSFSKNHRVAADNKAVGVAARGGRILELGTMTPEINRVVNSGDRRKIQALVDAHVDRLLPILQKNFGSGRTSPASRRSVRAPQASLAPSTSQSMIDSTTEVVAAIPIEEQAALLAGTLSIMQQAVEQTSKIEKEILFAPIVINPDVHGKTRDNADATSDPLAPKTREARVPEVVALEKTGSKRAVEVQTAVPVSSHLAKVSNGNIPFGDQLQTSHEPMLLGDYDGNPNTPYGVVQSMHGFA